MEVITGALPRLLLKLRELLVGEYNLQKEVKGGIMFLQAELESMKVALDKISMTPTDHLDNQDKIWAGSVRELSYDIEDKIDSFMVHCKGNKPDKHHGFKKFIDKSLDLLMQPKVRRKIATDIRDIKCRVKEVSERRDRYNVNISDVPNKPITVDPRLFTQYENTAWLVGIEEARDEVLKILMEGNERSMHHDKIVSIVGFGGLGKTTLANMVYEDLRPKFDCSAFISVSRTPDKDKLFKDMFYKLSKKQSESIDVIDELRELLDKKRYLIVLDDIWDISIWRMIKCALPDNSLGCKIIMTTRILSVAEQAGSAYKLQPLSLQNSRKLLYRRIFTIENKNNNTDQEELPEMSNKILKKCAGIPLAIITIASLLASKGRNNMEWNEVYNSVGTGMENSLDTENMRKILSYSYYDLPSCLRTCLLYLTVFPEDFDIEKDRLIWLWIAEGFLQCEERGKSLFELGESYFRKLIDRSMIQPVDRYNTGTINHCRVHDMVLDLIRSLSSAENFVTTLNNMDYSSPLKTTRRLSIQSGKVDEVTWDTKSMKQLRSVVVFPSAINQMPALRCFKVLRILDLQGCDLSKGCSLKFIGYLFHLRYLGLRGTHITQLPEEVGNLQFLETLDLWDNNISSLPWAIAHLKHLMCLWVQRGIRVSNWIGRLTSLEELSLVHIENESTDTIEELGLLTELRVLNVSLSRKWNDKFVECLCKLQKIQTLYITKLSGEKRNVGGLDAWIAPGHLRRLQTQGACWFSTLPSWMNPSDLWNISILSIAVMEMRQEDLENLGRLPALRYLDLQVDHKKLEVIRRFVCVAGLFPTLVRCELRGFVVPVVFLQGAMPRLSRLDLTFHVRVTRETAGTDGSLDLGLDNLTSLQKVCIGVRSGGASKEEVKETKASVRQATGIHPNHPTLEIYVLQDEDSDNE